MTNTAVFDSPALPLLFMLQDQGFELRLSETALQVRPWSRVSPELRAKLRSHKSALVSLIRMCDSGVIERRRAFCDQLRASPDTLGPFLFRPGLPYQRGLCFSCGDRLPAARFGRCWRCSLAWRLTCRVEIPAEVARAYDQSKVVA